MFDEPTAHEAAQHSLDNGAQRAQPCAIAGSSLRFSTPGAHPEALALSYTAGFSTTTTSPAALTTRSSAPRSASPVGRLGPSSP